MGTLTADCPRLADHCPHKLPTSCRLTATGECCACQDTRSHSLTYPMYVDGVGFVQRGTRWQGYCWFCKTFWENRVNAAGLSPTESRIPEDPEQNEFVEKWFEFHQGYRVIKHIDGREEREPVVAAEALSDADPGRLPRTRPEISRGQYRLLQSDIRRREQQERYRITQEASTPQVSLEDALDALLEEDSDQEGDDDEPTQLSPEAADQPASTAQGPAASVDGLAEAEAALNVAREQRALAGSRLEDADTNVHRARERLRRMQREQVTRRNMTRVFGTAEDVQHEDYVSPITSMFVRQIQWARHNAERQSTADGQQASRPPAASGNSVVLEQSIAIAPETSGFQEHTVHDSDNAARHSASDALAALSMPVSGQQARAQSTHDSDIAQGLQWQQIAGRSSIPIRELLAARGAQIWNIDEASRPLPKTVEAMRFKLECKICLEQIADTACLPCGHLSMCEWCADHWIPTKSEDKTRPKDKWAKCPCCRAKVKSRVKIYPV